MIDKNYLKTLNVLYYEPDEILGETVTTVLRNNFNHVIYRSRMSDAIAAFVEKQSSNSKIDLVIMEIGGDGVVLLDNIRTIDKEVDIYIVTAYSNSSYLLQSIKSKVIDYILKPLDLKYLLETISNGQPRKFDAKKFISGAISVPKFQFSNVVVVSDNLIGCIVKTWSASRNRGIHYEVYVRAWNRIEEFNEEDIKHFIYDKKLEEDDS